MGQKQMSQKEFEAMVGGTIMEEAMAVDLADVVAPDDKVKNKDAVLDTMRDLEKRFYFLAYQKRKSLETICADCKKGVKTDDEKALLHRKYNKAEEQLDRSNELMWAFIKMRFGSVSMAIREGFQIESTGNCQFEHPHAGIAFGGIPDIDDFLAHVLP